MKSEHKIKTQIMVLMSLLVILCSFLFAVAHYKAQKASLLAGIDSKLLASANFAKAILPDNYHDSITDKNSVPADEYLKMIDRYNKLCSKLNLEYLWSLMKIDDQIVFTSSTSKDKNVENGQHALFFDVHSNPKAYQKAFEKMQVDYRINKDKWGHSRVVLVPFYDNQERKYLFGASMKTSEVDTLLKKTIFLTTVICMVILAVGLILSRLFANTLSKPLNKLSIITTNIASGDLKQKIDYSGSYEIKSLARNIQIMSEAINDKTLKLQASEEKFRELAEALPQIIFELDLHGNLLYSNQKGFESTGYTIDDFNKGLNAIQFVIPEERERLAGNIQKMIEELIDSSNEYTLLRKDGSTFNAIIYSRPIIQDNIAVGFRGVIADITDLKNVIKEKEKLETQLRQAYKMEAIGTMAGGIAHDFNNILTIILGNADIALDDIPEDNPARYNIHKVLDASKRAKDLVKQILTFSRVGDSDLKPHHLQHHLKEIFKLLRPTIPTTVKIQQSICSDCRPVLADPTQIHQLVMNFCNNAVQAMDEKGIIKISLAEVELEENEIDPHFNLEPGKYACLTVSDTGIGMTKKVIESIFDPFFTTKGVGEGTGMGLSVVHGIVENHKGGIKVDSKPGEGTTFQVFFPIVEEGVTDEMEESEQLPRGNEKILFIDDEDMLAEVGSTILTMQGYQVTAKTSSRDALETFKSDPEAFDLVITDQSMPDMSGAELAAEFIRIRPDIPIILYTGYSKKISVEQAKKIGIKELCVKPLGRRQLAEVVRKVLDEK